MRLLKRNGNNNISLEGIKCTGLIVISVSQPFIIVRDSALSRQLYNRYQQLPYAVATSELHCGRNSFPFFSHKISTKLKGSVKYLKLHYMIN